MFITNSLAVTRYLLGASDSVTRGGSPPGGTLMPPVVVSLWTAKTSSVLGAGITVNRRIAVQGARGQGNVPQIRWRGNKRGHVFFRRDLISSTRARTISIAARNSPDRLSS